MTLFRQAKDCSLPRGAALLAAGTAALLAGCAPVPRLGVAPPPLAQAGTAATQSLAPTVGAPSAWPGEGWWQAYGDPQLDALVAEGLSAAPDIALAQARLDRAAALARSAGAARLPQAEAQAGVQQEKQSLNLGFPPSFKPVLPQGWNDGGQITASLGFDLDLWGRNRAALAAATSQRRAAALDLQQARLLLSVAIVSAYVDLDRLVAERDIRAAQVRSLEQTGEIADQRVENGLENIASTAQARGAVALARIALSQAEESEALRRSQIAALVGAGPDRGLALRRPALSAVTVRGIPATATTELVARRPDVAAARERVAAGASSMREARAGFFPSLSLNALFGVQSLGLERLFEADSTYGRVGPAVSLPIFRGGALAARYRGARADYDAAVASYNATVLGAYRETADAVTATRLVTERLAQARAAAAASEEALATVTARYKAGLVSYLDVLQVDDRRLDARLTLAAIEAAARGADLALVRALGGGFSSATATATAPMTAMKDTPHG
ncbi:efflux transporter outer membrane subunit [Novosphingobium piscinae]|uniref:Efflux transporter outer membrane subunit n=1 Tax=Novosphingobium piscinae TaxID=1507448 RepID=A0A7X1G0H4_9SPHN|nr:efflux transporter outer membrane subunit [Novosphingobium piscinae]MBC2670373.1 efflux transporter outer membrane subunit [Novosphingobium piscinae]